MAIVVITVLPYGLVTSIYYLYIYIYIAWKHNSLMASSYQEDFIKKITFGILKLDILIQKFSFDQRNFFGTKPKEKR